MYEVTFEDKTRSLSLSLPPSPALCFFSLMLLLLLERDSPHTKYTALQVLFNLWFVLPPGILFVCMDRSVSEYHILYLCNMFGTVFLIIDLILATPLQMIVLEVDVLSCTAYCIYNPAKYVITFSSFMCLQIQKFALRFVSVYETDQFISSLKVYLLISFDVPCVDMSVLYRVECYIRLLACHFTSFQYKHVMFVYQEILDDSSDAGEPSSNFGSARSPPSECVISSESPYR